MRDHGWGWRGSDADEMDDVGRGCRSKEMLTTRSSGAGSDFQRRSPAGAVRSPAWRGWARPLGNLVTGQTPRAWSRRERQCAQSGEGTTELVLPGPALRQMQGESARLAGDASGQGEEASSEGLGGRHRCSPRPMRVVQRARLWAIVWDGQPGGVGGKAARGEMVETHAVLEVADGVLDLGMAAVVRLEFQGVAVSIGDEAVIAVVDQAGPTGSWAWAAPFGRCGAPARRRAHSGSRAHSGMGHTWIRPRRRRPPSSTGWASSPSRVWPR